jgi:Pyruvate/2-oxoacid:ferredoxin oxidoreductase gamma subunit
MAHAARLPDAPPRSTDSPWDLLITGVGGTGVVTVGAVIAMAAHLEGQQASVLDFMGFAQKGGSVLSFVRIAPTQELLNQVRIDTQQADAVLACDAVVAASPEALQTIRHGRTRVLVNVHETPVADAVRVLRREPWSLRAQKNLRATRIRLARRDAGRTGTAVVETQPPTRTVIGELLPLDLAVPLAVLAQLAALALWFARRRSKGELARVGLAAATALTLTVALGVIAVIAARRSIPPGAVVLRDGLRMKRAPRVDAIPEGALREGERVDVLTRDGEFVRVRTIAGRAGWLAGRDLGALTE